MNDFGLNDEVYCPTAMLFLCISNLFYRFSIASFFKVDRALKISLTYSPLPILFVLFHSYTWEFDYGN